MVVSESVSCGQECGKRLLEYMEEDLERGVFGFLRVSRKYKDICVSEGLVAKRLAKLIHLLKVSWPLSLMTFLFSQCVPLKSKDGEKHRDLS